MGKKDKFHALLAVEPEIKNQAKAMLNETKKVFSKHENFVQRHEVYAPYEEGGIEIPPKSSEMTTTVDKRLAYNSKFLVRLFDHIYQKEATNALAKADLVVDGLVLAENVPATALLTIEGWLKEVREDIYKKIPTLDPQKIYTPDEATGKGVYIANDEWKIKTEKQTVPLVLYDATPEHPAKVDKIQKDVPIGKWTLKTRSSMWAPSKLADTLERVENMIRAVKKARQRATDQEIQHAVIGKKIFDYIHG